MKPLNCDFLVVWEFWVRPGAEARFASAYGPLGAWVQLFSGDPEYGGTRLVRDWSEPRRYLTLDSWASQSAYESFRAQHGPEYAAVDRECEGLTEREAEVGRFAAVPY